MNARILVVAQLLVVCPSLFAANIGLGYWQHWSYAYNDTAAGETWTRDSVPIVPESPFTGATSATLGSTSASASYDFEFTQLGGTFRITGAHLNTSIGWETRSWAGGLLYLEPDVPIVVSFSGVFTGTTSGSQTEAGVGFDIMRDYDGTVLYRRDAGVGGMVGTHTCGVAGQFTLQPGMGYDIEYGLGLTTYPLDPAGVVESGTGEATIVLAAVPEPGTVIALLLAPALGHRRIRWCGHGLVRRRHGTIATLTQAQRRTSA